MRKIEKTIPYLLLILMFLIIIFSFRASPFSKVLSEHDSSMFLYFGRGISDGMIPYKDMLDHKGPVLFMIQYLAFLVGLGNIHLGIWIVECFFLAGTIIFLYKNNYIYTEDKKISALSLLFLTPFFVLCYEGGNLSEEYALFFISFSLYIFSKSISKNNVSNINYISVGFFGALTFFIRMNMISVWVVYCLFLVYINVKDGCFGELSRQFKYIFLGGIVSVAIIVSLSIYQGNLRDMIQQSFMMNISYSVSTTGEKFQASLKYIDILLNMGVFPLVIIYFISLFSIKKNSLTSHYPLIIYLFLNYVTVILSGRAYYHYLTTEIAPLSTIIAVSIQFILWKIEGSYKRIVSFILVLVIVIPTSYGVFKSHNWSDSSIENSDQSQIKDLSSFIKNNTTKDDAIYVHNLDANIYLLSGRYSNSKFFVLPAINYDNSPELKKEFEQDFNLKLPKFIVLSKDFSANPNISSNLNGFISEVIKEKYHLISPIKSESFLTYEINN